MIEAAIVAATPIQHTSNDRTVSTNPLPQSPLHSQWRQELYEPPNQKGYGAFLGLVGLVPVGGVTIDGEDGFDIVIVNSYVAPAGRCGVVADTDGPSWASV